MDEHLSRQLEGEFHRLRIGSNPAEVRTVVGEPPWLYAPEFLLAVARTLPDGAGARALGQALAAGRTSRGTW
jgi:hypothetical protein